MAVRRDFDSLAGRLDAIADRLTSQVEGIVAIVVREIGRELVPATPVLTGFARANWRPSVNAPAPLPVSFLDPTGQATVAKIETTGKLYRAGDVFFIVNRTPYIVALNSGSSPQAEAGFVERAIGQGVHNAFRGLEFDLG